MALLSLHRKKRAPVLVGVMFCGVIFAGFISSALTSPVSVNSYLHDHLNLPMDTSNITWTAHQGELSNTDRAILTSIITGAERPDWTTGHDTPVTGQALDAAGKSNCSKTSETCELHIRVRREFSEDHINRDLRVANVMERSRRIAFVIDPDASDLTLSEIANETRLFRFYQTQTGWTQKTLEVLSD